MHAFYNHRSKLKYRDEVVGRVGRVGENWELRTSCWLKIVVWCFY